MKLRNRTLFVYKRRNGRQQRLSTIEKRCKKRNHMRCRIGIDKSYIINIDTHTNNSIKEDNYPSTTKNSPSKTTKNPQHQHHHRISTTPFIAVLHTFPTIYSSTYSNVYSSSIAIRLERVCRRWHRLGTHFAWSQSSAFSYASLQQQQTNMSWRCSIIDDCPTARW